MELNRVAELAAALVPSNELNPGDTHDNPWPTDDPGRGDDRDPGEPSAKPDQY